MRIVSKEDRAVPILEVRGLKKHFPIYAGVFRKQVATVKAVDGIDFRIFPGQTVGLVGESGCGKSTAAKTAIRLLTPTEGSVFFDGQEITQLPEKRLTSLRRYVQVVFQDPMLSLNPRKSIGDTLAEPIRYHRLLSNPSAIHQRVAELLQLVGLNEEARRRYPHQFSGGQLQRICIARALALQPRLIVCDEAVSALDISVQGQILNLLADLQQQFGLSYLFIAHNLSVVRHSCDHVIVMYLGHVMESAPAQQLFAHPKHPYTQALLSATPKEHPEQAKRRLLLSGELPSPVDPPSGCPFRTRCPLAREKCSEDPPLQTIGAHHHFACIYAPDDLELVSLSK